MAGDIRLSNHARKRWEERTNGRPVRDLYWMVQNSLPANKRVGKLVQSIASRLAGCKVTKTKTHTRQFPDSRNYGTRIITDHNREYAFIVSQQPGHLLVVTVFSIPQLEEWRSMDE